MGVLASLNITWITGNNRGTVYSDRFTYYFCLILFVYYFCDYSVTASVFCCYYYYYIVYIFYKLVCTKEFAVNIQDSDPGSPYPSPLLPVRNSARQRRRVD